MISLLVDQKKKPEKQEKQQSQQHHQQMGGGQKVTPAQLRIAKETSSLDIPKNLAYIEQNKDNISQFLLMLYPDKDSLWYKGKYKFTIDIPNDYPHKAPHCMCITPIYHPNIDTKGNVCLNILRESWKPTLDIQAIIHGLLFLFTDPNAEDPLNKDAATVMLASLPNFKSIVRKTLKGQQHKGIQYPKFT